VLALETLVIALPIFPNYIYILRFNKMQKLYNHSNRQQLWVRTQAIIWLIITIAFFALTRCQPQEKVQFVDSEHSNKVETRVDFNIE
jgi:hypothetical protein